MTQSVLPVKRLDPCHILGYGASYSKGANSMKLKDYLVKNKLTARYIATRTGVTVSAARKWCQGTRIPRLPTIKKIHRITQGEVSVNDWQ